MQLSAHKSLRRGKCIAALHGWPLVAIVTLLVGSLDASSVRAQTVPAAIRKGDAAKDAALTALRQQVAAQAAEIAKLRRQLASLPASVPSEDPELAASEMEGLSLYDFRITNSAGKASLRATVTAHNATRFHITSLTIRLDLYRTATPKEGGTLTLLTSMPYTVAVNLSPLEVAVTRSLPIPYRAKKETPVHGYYMTLLSAQGTPVTPPPETPLITRLSMAAWTGDVDTLIPIYLAHPDLIQAGLDRNGDPLLVGAIMGSHTEAVSILIDAGAPINQKSRNGYTALMYAVAYGNPEIVKLLLYRKADVTLKNPEGKTALQQAVERVALPRAYSDNTQIVQMLQAAQ